MRRFPLASVRLVILAGLGFAAGFAPASHAQTKSDPGFTGTWKFNAARSEVHGLPSAPDAVLKVAETNIALDITASEKEAGAGLKYSYPLDGKEVKAKIADSTISTATKWEGAALLVNRIVAGPQNYSVMERWRKSRDGSTLTIRRTIVRMGAESESTLIYENAAMPSISLAPGVTNDAGVTVIPSSSAKASPPPAPAFVTTADAKEKDVAAKTSKNIVVPAGTRILLRLTSSVNTKGSSKGDRVYLESAVPVSVDDEVVIPRGSQVTGTVIAAQRAGRLSGKASLNLRFESLSLPNGVTRDFRALPGSVDTVGNVEKAEGKIEGESTKGQGGRAASSAGTGARVGSLGGPIGAAAGAAAGLAGVLLSRGEDVVLPPGTTVEMILDRDLHFNSDELSR